MPNYAVTERQALADLMLEVGPDAPTLCAGWTTRDLAAHLVIRDRRPDAAIGIVVPPLAGRTENIQNATRDKHDYAELVELVRSGPPSWSPVRLAAVNKATNTVEYFVHHEDVRRAQPEWEPRALDAEMESSLWSRLRAGAKLMMRKSPVGVVLESADGDRVAVRESASSQVTLRGKPSELTLVAFGRGKHVRVEASGNQADVDRVLGTSFGI